MLFHLDGGAKLSHETLHLGLGLGDFADAAVFLPDGRCLIGTELGFILELRPEMKVARRHSVHDTAVRGLSVNDDGSRVYATAADDRVAVLDVATMQPIVTFHYISSEGILALTPDGYFCVPPAMADYFHFAKDNRTYSFSQFDLRSNRPDIVLERLGGEREQIEMMRRARLKRMRRAGVTEDMLADGYHAPQAAIVNADALETDASDGRVRFRIELSDSLEALERVMVWLNGVPQLGLDGRAIASGGHAYATEIDLELASGANHIAVAGRNARGAVSPKAEVVVDAPARRASRRLFVVAVGVSRYADPRYNLNYAAKDAADLAALIRAQANGFDEVCTLLVTDDDFSSQSPARIRRFLDDAGRDDAVLLFFAGHGVLDVDLDYYLAPHDMDFDAPAARGITLEQFTATLDGIRPLRRYVVLDACHSGVIDKEDYLAANVTKLPSGSASVVFRGALSLHERSAEVERINSLIADMFGAAGPSDGSLIVSSASGMEVAVEGNEWQNGLFTYLLKQGIEGAAADADGDGRLTVEELVRYAVAEAPRVTDGSQNPTIRGASSATPLTLKICSE